MIAGCRVVAICCESAVSIGDDLPFGHAHGATAIRGADIPIVVEILGVRHHDILTDQPKGLVEHLHHPGQFARVEDTRRVHRDVPVR